MAHWLVIFNDETRERIYKCSNCGIKYKEEYINGPKYFGICLNCGDDITGAAVDHSEKYTKEKVEEMFKIGEETQKLADDIKKEKKDQSIPGIYERYMMDILDYLQAKFPQLGKDELMEAVGYISSRSMVMVQDTLIEMDREWKKIIDDLNKNHERNLKMTLKAAGLKVEV